MFFLSRFKATDTNAKEEAVSKLIERSTTNFDFLLFVVLSALIVTVGLRLDNDIIILGGALIAPVLYPILSLALSLILSDYALLRRSLYAVIKAGTIGAFVGFVASLLLSGWATDPTVALLAYREPSFLFFAVAFLAGFAVPYAMVKSVLSESLSGVVLSIAVIPPLAAFGIGLSEGSALIITGSLNILLINIGGILFGSMMAFSLMDFHRERKVAITTVKKEEKRIEKHEQKLEEEVKKEEETIAA